MQIQANTLEFWKRSADNTRDLVEVQQHHTMSCSTGNVIYLRRARCVFDQCKAMSVHLVKGACLIILALHGPDWCLSGHRWERACGWFGNALAWLRYGLDIVVTCFLNHLVCMPLLFPDFTRLLSALCILACRLVRRYALQCLLAGYPCALCLIACLLAWCACFACCACCAGCACCDCLLSSSAVCVGTMCLMHLLIIHYPV